MKTSALVFTVIFIGVLALGLVEVFRGSISESFSVPHAHIHN